MTTMMRVSAVRPPATSHAPAPHVPALVERDRELQALLAARDAAASGQGRIALLLGEAGIGKTFLLENLVRACGRGMRVVTAQCDRLSTPSALGPLHDIAQQTGGELPGLLSRETPCRALFAAALDALCAGPAATMLIVEDIHWADDATLDLLRFLSRRIADRRMLLVLSCRDDEAGGRPALRILLGDLATARTALRLELQPFSEAAVRRLAAGRDVDAGLLYRRTSGNPFFVVEVLAQEGEGIPASVRDAVLARVAALGPAGRMVAEAAAVIGPRIDLAVLEGVAGPDIAALSLCLHAGILETRAGGTGFRHELMREAVLLDIDPSRRRELFRRALWTAQGLGPGRVDPAQLGHFALGTGDAGAIREFGLAAARAAIELGSHRAAATHLRNVLNLGGPHLAAERATLLDLHAEECALIDELAEAAQARADSAALWRSLGERLKEGEALAAMAWPLVRSARNAEAEEASRRAIAVLETLPPGPQLAAAYRVRAHLRMLDRDRPAALHWGHKAIALARTCRDESTLAAAEMVVGSAMLVSGDEAGCDHLHRGLQQARDAGLDSLVALGHLNIGSIRGEHYQFADAERHLLAGISFAAKRDLDHAQQYMSAWLALTRLYQGQWKEAEEIAGALLTRPNLAVITRIMALVAVGRVRVRRGDSDAGSSLDEALDLALRTGTLQRLAPVRAARAEAAWLAGDSAGVVEEALAAYELAVRHEHRWHVGELSFWRWKAGERSTAPDWSARPFLLQVRGDWLGAAVGWRERGCPYEEARALADGDRQAQLKGLAIFDRLGAEPASAALRQALRRDGARGVPRGPRPPTRRNPFGLTTREMDILQGLVDGLSNGRIALRLRISAKTVDHHVSAVLGKLGVATRGEAALLARRATMGTESAQS